MEKIKEVVVVEGRYDTNAIKQAVDATVIETAGFGIFSNKEKLKLIRRLANERGVIILTDSDGAGFLIRSYLKGSLPKDRVKHAYIPDMFGKEARKAKPSAEGKLGVEAMKRQVILKAFEKAGATFERAATAAQKSQITKVNLYMDGMSGKSDSAQKRAALLKYFDLPERLTVNAMLDTLNIITDIDGYKKAVEEIEKGNA